MVNFKIDGRELSVPKGTTILEAAEKAGIPIPHLCFLKEITPSVLCPGDSPGKNIGVGCHALLHEIFLTQESNLRLLQVEIGRWVLYH